MKKTEIGRIGVLMGGPSSERQISLKSGRAVYQALKGQGLDAVPLDIGHNCLSKIKQAKIALAFIALHGRFGEDGGVQKILESLHIPYTGSGVKASYLCLDKLASRRIFKQQQIPVPEYQVLEGSSWRNRLKELKLKFPLVAKPATQGSSIGVTFVDGPRRLNRAIGYALTYDDTAIIERYIKGRELTVGILEDAPLPVVEIRPRRRFFDFRAKYEPGQSDYIVPAKITQRLYQQVQHLGLKAHKALGCRGFSRVDLILSRGRPFILEVNSIPGLTQGSLLPLAAQAEGISFAQLCLKLVHLALGSRK